MGSVIFWMGFGLTREFRPLQHHSRRTICRNSSNGGRIEGRSFTELLHTYIFRDRMTVLQHVYRRARRFNLAFGQGV